MREKGEERKKNRLKAEAWERGERREKKGERHVRERKKEINKKCSNLL